MACRPMGKKSALVQWAASAVSTAGVFFRPRPVVEREHRLAFPQEIVCLKLLKAETGATCRVDLDDAGDAECIGVGRAREGSARRM